MMIQHPEYEQPKYEDILEVYRFEPFKLRTKTYFDLQDRVSFQGWTKKRSDVKEYADSFTDIISSAHPVRRVETFEQRNSEGLLLIFEGTLDFVNSGVGNIAEINRIRSVGDARIYLATYVPESMKSESGINAILKRKALKRQLREKMYRACDWLTSGILQNTEPG